MPRSSIVLSPEPIDRDAVAAALRTPVFAPAHDAGEFELRTMDDDAVLQVLVQHVVVLSLLRPRLLPGLDEVARLLPGVDAPTATRWWAEAYTPWRPEGAIGMAILDAAAAASSALVVHQGIPPAAGPHAGAAGSR
ncbi:hypothetical protein IF188_10960 [Microbacterium sp. NEAU-LLC]|uniref:Uncharacterized protein n=1 Tax=Microbacterium helvum TaxID=2773713 RepID=A0ABR8NNH4_9MICO|nr:hypothetical protein [Microbacterium helvum]MBD3942215.1 hypothetical protein [Microbacterium helvum]